MVLQLEVHHDIFMLQSFLKLFKQSFMWAAQALGAPAATNSKSGPHEADILARNALLSDKLLELVHAAVSRALFNKDQLTLAVHLARNLLPDQFPPEEWAVFLSCNSSLTGGSASSITVRSDSQSDAANIPAAPTWVRSEYAAAFEQVATALPNLVAAAQLQDGRVWAQWAASTASVAADVAAAAGALEFVPTAVASRLTGLQQLILVAAFRPDRYATPFSLSLPSAPVTC